MSAIPFDTHALVKRLQGAGFTEQQAEIIADTQRETSAATIEQAKHDYHLDDLATKRDIDARIKETELKIELVRAELKKDLYEIEGRLGVKIAEARTDLTRWVVSVAILQSTLLIAALMKMLRLI